MHKRRLLLDSSCGVVELVSDFGPGMTVLSLIGDTFVGSFFERFLGREAALLSSISEV